VFDQKNDKFPSKTNTVGFAIFKIDSYLKHIGEAQNAGIKILSSSQYAAIIKSRWRKWVKATAITLVRKGCLGKFATWPPASYHFDGSNSF